MLSHVQAENPLITYALDPFAREHLAYLQNFYTSEGMVSFPDRFKTLAITE